jgi:hypothetical protein
MPSKTPRRGLFVRWSRAERAPERMNAQALRPRLAITVKNALSWRECRYGGVEFRNVSKSFGSTRVIED